MLADVLVVSVAQMILVFGLSPSDAARGPMAFLLAVVYHVGLLAHGGQTIGKMLAGIVVVTKDEEPLGLKGAIVRYLSLCVTAPFGVIAFFDDERRALHDRFAGTRVVYAGEPGTARLFVFGALGFAWVAVPLTTFFFALFAMPKLMGVTRLGPAKRPPPAEVAAAFDKAPEAAVETPSQLPPRPEVAGRTRDVSFNPSVARFQAQVKPERVPLDADWPALPGGKTWTDRHENWTRHDLELRAAVRDLESEVYRLQRADALRRFPADLSRARVPRIKLPDHPATSAVALYGPEVCTGKPGADRIAPSKLKETGGWGYVSDPRASCWGAVFLDCAHEGAQGPFYK